MYAPQDFVMPSSVYLSARSRELVFEYSFFIGVREHKDQTKILEDIITHLTKHHPKERGEELRSILYARRYPEQARYEQEATRLQSELRRKGWICTFDQCFERGGVELEIQIQHGEATNPLSDQEAVQDFIVLHHLSHGTYPC